MVAKVAAVLTMTMTMTMGLSSWCFAAGKSNNLAEKVQKSEQESFRSNLQRASQADALRLKSIANIQQMLRSSPDDSKVFELFLRLGELYGERSEYLKSLEILNWERLQDQWRKTGQGVEPQLTHEASKAELLNAAAAFRHILNAYPDHQRIDAALFSLAKALDELANDQAISYYKTLVQNYPNSPLMPEAYLSIGEYYFTRNQYETSLPYYLKASQYKGAKTYTYAVYKLGWAYYNSDGGSEDAQYKLYQKALAAFKLTVRLSDRNRKWRGVDLRREAINDLVMVWSEIEGVQDAWAFFSKMGEHDAFYDVLERLGNTYADQGKSSLAIATFSRLIKEAPTREQTPEIYLKLIGLYDHEGDLKSVFRSFGELHELTFALGSSRWLAQHKANLTAIKEAQDRHQKELHRYAALYHQRGQNNNNDEYMKQAMVMYRFFLEKFPADTNAYEIRYYLADIYSHFKMYNAASDEYLRVALQNPNGKYLKDAALNAVVAINTLVEAKEWPELPKLGTVASPIPIPREKIKLVNVIDTYVKLLPGEPQGFAMRISAAKILFVHGHYNDALARFETIALTLPHTQEGKVSLETILNFHTNRKQWLAVISKSRQFLASKALLTGTHPQTITAHLKNAVFQLAVAYNSGKQHLNAAKTFLAFQKEFPLDPNADKALFNASQNLYEVDLVDQALQIDRQLLSEYPQSALVPDVNLSIARIYEGIADYGEAANFYALFAQTYPQDERSAAAVYNAAVLYKGLKQYELSLRNFQKFVNSYPSHSNSADAYYEMAVIFEKTKAYPDAINSYRRYLQMASSISRERALYIEALAATLDFVHVDRQRGGASLTALRDMLINDKTTAAETARSLVAQTFFDAITPRLNQFKSLKLTSARTLEQDVQSKQALLLAIAAEYEDIIAIASGEYVVASLYQLGQLHEQFAEDLFKAPDPIASDQLTIDQYRSSIEKAAFPLKEEAFKYYELAFKRSGEVATFTDWTKRSYQKVAELFPQRHPEILEKELDPGYLSHKLSMMDDVERLVEQ